MAHTTIARRIGLAGATCLAASSLATAAEAPQTVQELWEVIQRQQQEIERLKSQVKSTDAKVEATGEMVERTRQAVSEEGGDTRGAHVGGYGELHYNNLDNQRAGGEDKDMLDLHRFVLEFGYDFDARTRFFSELEVEHALSGDGAPGEVELEQAYVERDLSDSHRVKGGVFLVPAGILNPTHEPPTFYGVERNPVEKHIIPTTWWEGGGMVSGELAPGLSYDAGVHSGLKTDAAGAYAIREGRQKIAKADAEDLAATGRLKWTGMPGLELAATAQYQADISQSSDPAAGSATLFETHAVWNNAGSAAQDGLGLRALYARWDLDGSGPAAVGADLQEGWYVEPSYKFTRDLGVFARYNQWDNQAGDGADSELTQTNLGVNYWPHPDVVLKADLQTQDAPAGEDEFDGFNVGIGYQF